MFEDMMEEATVVDCMVEIHEIRSKAKILSDERLISYIMEWDSSSEINDETQYALHEFFNTGKLSPENRQSVEDCYTLMRNVLCWGEDEDASGVYSTHVLLK